MKPVFFFVYKDNALLLLQVSYRSSSFYKKKSYAGMALCS